MRRRNLIPAEACPTSTALGLNYDCGDFAPTRRRRWRWPTGPASPRAARKPRRRGRLRGIGIANPIEKAAGPGQEFAEIRFHPSGNVDAADGQQEPGPGARDRLQAGAARALGLDPADVQYIDGDTDRVAFGIGTNGSRSTVIGGSALWIAADKVIAKGKRSPHICWRPPRPTSNSRDGQFTVAGTDRASPSTDVAKAVVPRRPRCRPAWKAGSTRPAPSRPPTTTYPNGCHVCEVEIDPETGAVDIVRYVVVDDVGTVVNPIGLKGQIHGGVAQGLGQALMEQIVYDREPASC